MVFSTLINKRCQNMLNGYIFYQAYDPGPKLYYLVI